MAMSTSRTTTMRKSTWILATVGNLGPRRRPRSTLIIMTPAAIREKFWISYKILRRIRRLLLRSLGRHQSAIQRIELINEMKPTCISCDDDTVLNDPFHQPTEYQSIVYKKSRRRNKCWEKLSKNLPISNRVKPFLSSETIHKIEWISLLNFLDFTVSTWLKYYPIRIHDIHQIVLFFLLMKWMMIIHINSN